MAKAGDLASRCKAPKGRRKIVGRSRCRTVPIVEPIALSKGRDAVPPGQGKPAGTTTTPLPCPVPLTLPGA